MKLLRDSKLTPILAAFFMLQVVLLVGLVGYHILGFTLVEAFYQTVITIATVGFKEVHPLSDAGMIFTAFLIIFSFGIFAYAVTTLTRYIVEGVYRNTLKDSKLKRRIQKLNGHVVICGYGRNGKQAVQELLDHDVPVLIIENNAHIIDSLQDDPQRLYLDGDAVDEEVLLKANIEHARALITTLPTDADNLFVVLTAKEINPDIKIISRASVDHADVKLKRAGATNVIMPDKIGGQRMAKLVAQPDVVEFVDYLLLQSTEDVMLEQISCAEIDTCFGGKTIGELDLRNHSGANIIGIKRENKEYYINPMSDTVLTATDRLFVLGTRNQIDRLKKIIVEGA